MGGTFTSRVKAWKMFVLGNLLSKNIAPHEIVVLTLAGAVKRGWEGLTYSTFATLYPVDKIGYTVGRSV